MRHGGGAGCRVRAGLGDDDGLHHCTLASISARSLALHGRPDARSHEWLACLHARLNSCRSLAAQRACLRGRLDAHRQRWPARLHACRPLTAWRARRTLVAQIARVHARGANQPCCFTSRQAVQEASKQVGVDRVQASDCWAPTHPKRKKQPKHEALVAKN